MGYRNVRDWYHNTVFRERKRGPKEKKHERAFVFTYVAFQIAFNNLTEDRACIGAARLFKLPLDRVELWCMQKHRYSDEREAANEIIQIAKLFTNGSAEELHQFLMDKVPSLFEN